MLLDRWADNLQRAFSTSVETDGRWVSCSGIQAHVQDLLRTNQGNIGKGDRQTTKNQRSDRHRAPAKISCR